NNPTCNNNNSNNNKLTCQTVHKPDMVEPITDDMRDSSPGAMSIVSSYNKLYNHNQRATAMSAFTVATDYTNYTEDDPGASQRSRIHRNHPSLMSVAPRPTSPDEAPQRPVTPPSNAVTTTANPFRNPPTNPKTLTEIPNAFDRQSMATTNTDVVDAYYSKAGHESTQPTPTIQPPPISTYETSILSSTSTPSPTTPTQGTNILTALNDKLPKLYAPASPSSLRESVVIDEDLTDLESENGETIEERRRKYMSLDTVHDEDV
ncbi:hypothetical protein BC829DRAFT_395839, partial [Chytridium lagenaria]